MNEYYSDRERGPRARVNNEIGQLLWCAIRSLIESRIIDGSFGKEFPEHCRDGNYSLSIISTNEKLFEERLSGVVGDIWINRYNYYPGTYQILDLIQFCYNYITEPQEISAPYMSIQKHYDYTGHVHLRFDVEAGRNSFIEEINTLFARNGIAYELKSNGEIQRLLPPELEEAVISTRFNTGDEELDCLLNLSRERFLTTDSGARKDAVEKLWDAWERFKSLEMPGNKRESTRILLDNTTGEEHLRGLLENEARTLTDIGNTFMIRHSETDKVPLEREEDNEYLFYRMFSLILLILKTTGRCR